MPKQRIIIADDHSLIRSALKELIEKGGEYVVAALVKDGEELLDTLTRKKCDLVILDICMPKMDGLTALRHLRQDHPSVKVLIFSMINDYAHFHDTMTHGASGYLVKDEPVEEIMTAIKTVLAGHKFISPGVTTLLAEREVRTLDEALPSLEILTHREKEILAMVAKGLLNKNIAAALKVSIRTVEHHREHLTQKLGYKDTASLVKYALSKGIA